MQGQLDPRSFVSTQRWLISWLAAELDLDADGIDAHQTFLSYGMDSMHAMMLAGDLEAALGTVPFSHPGVGLPHDQCVRRIRRDTGEPGKSKR